MFQILTTIWQSSVMTIILYITHVTRDIRKEGLRAYEIGGEYGN